MSRPRWEPGTTLEQYAAAWRDMAPHVATLVQLGRDARRIVEFGVRGGVSSWAFLTGLPRDGRLVSVDVDPRVRSLVPAPVMSDVRWRLVIGDSLHVRLPPTADVVLVDSSHERHQTLAELDRAAALRPRVLLAHDYQAPAYPGVAAAVHEFVGTRPWRVDRVEASPWGLAVLVPA